VGYYTLRLWRDCSTILFASLRLQKASLTNKNGSFQVWTHENHSIEVYGNRFIQSKIDYIHNNPVRAGIVRNAIYYKYSSASAYADEEGPLEIIKAGSTFRTVK
jgi:hypothetical protein